MKADLPWLEVCGVEFLSTPHGEKLLHAARRIGAPIVTIVNEIPQQWVPAQFVDLEVVNLSYLYKPGIHRLDNYRNVADIVFELIDKRMGAIFVTYGSPLVFDRVVTLLREISKSRGVRCKIRPSPSSIDHTLAYLGEDFAPGLQVVEARWLVQQRLRLERRLPALLFQIGAFWTDQIALSAQPNKLADLSEYLKGMYPAAHPCVAVRAPMFGCPPYHEFGRVGFLPYLTPEALKGTSLYIPGMLGPDTGAKQWWADFLDKGLSEVAREN